MSKVLRGNGKRLGGIRQCTHSHNDTLRVGRILRSAAKTRAGSQ
jgi:hypothetical protein